MVRHMRDLQPSAAVCPACPAPGGRARRPLETYTHLFLECPTYRLAIQWLADLWHAIDGVRPPLTAAAIIADEPGAWARAPEGERARLWAALRLTVLHAIWDARVSADASRCTARAVVLAAVESLRAEMRLQFTRSRLAADAAHPLPPALVVVQRSRPAPDDLAVWVSGGLCSVRQSSLAAAAASPRLDIHLDQQHPVIAPP